MPAPIILLCSGTRGDVQPVTALGLGLARAGLPVRIAAPPAFAGLIRDHGLGFIALDGNPSDLLAHPAGQPALTHDGQPLRSLAAGLGFWQAARPLYRRMLQSASREIRQASLIVAGLPTLWGAHLAEALGVPLVWAFTQPFARTQSFSSPLLTPWRLPVGVRMSYYLVDTATWLPWLGEIRRWRASLGLPASAANPAGRIHTGRDLLLYAFSPLVVPPPPDWPASHHVTGYWPLPAAPGWRPPESLQKFLESGPAPVYFGFGSPGAHSTRQSLGDILEALAVCGLRGVIQLPDGYTTRLPAWTVPVSAVPHEWLFPLLAAAVHHGGAGTTAAALLAGLPQLIAPRAVDQFFWGSRVHSLGVAPPPLPQHTWNAARLSAAVASLVSDLALRSRAGQLASDLASEDGVSAAVRHICALL